MIVVVAAERLKLLICFHACSLPVASNLLPVCVTSVFHLSSSFFRFLILLICTIDPNHSIHPDVFLVVFFKTQPNVSFYFVLFYFLCFGPVVWQNDYAPLAPSHSSFFHSHYSWYMHLTASSNNDLVWTFPLYLTHFVQSAIYNRMYYSCKHNIRNKRGYAC